MLSLTWTVCIFSPSTMHFYFKYLLFFSPPYFTVYVSNFHAFTPEVLLNFSHLWYDFHRMEYAITKATDKRVEAIHICRSDYTKKRKFWFWSIPDRDLSVICVIMHCNVGYLLFVLSGLFVDYLSLCNWKYGPVFTLDKHWPRFVDSQSLFDKVKLKCVDENSIILRIEFSILIQLLLK